MTDIQPWHYSRDNLVSLARSLVDDGSFSEPDAVVDYFEKPWHWDEAWSEFALNESDPYQEKAYTLPGNPRSFEWDTAYDALQADLAEYPLHYIDGNAYVYGKVHGIDTGGVRVVARRSYHEGLAYWAAS